MVSATIQPRDRAGLAGRSRRLREASLIRHTVTYMFVTNKFVEDRKKGRPPPGWIERPTGFGGGGGPVTGGSGRATLARALEGSSRRLNTDRIDLYWMHVWDSVTPAEEIVRGMADVIAAVKVLHFGVEHHRRRREPGTATATLTNLRARRIRPRRGQLRPPGLRCTGPGSLLMAAAVRSGGRPSDIIGPHRA